MTLPERADAHHDHALPGQATERVAEVLARIVAELEDVAGRIDANQAAIACAGTAALDDGVYVAAMQDADLSAQRIAGVAGFLRALADASPADWRLDTAPATGTLKLAALVETIGGCSRTAAAGHDGAARAGDVELF